MPASLSHQSGPRASILAAMRLQEHVGVASMPSQSFSKAFSSVPGPLTITGFAIATGGALRGSEAAARQTAQGLWANAAGAPATWRSRN